MTTQIQIRRDTISNWNTYNPILAEGEPGLELETGRVKYGDGTTNWLDLPYATGTSVNTGDITFNGDQIGSTTDVVNIVGNSYAQLQSNDSYIWVEQTFAAIEINANNIWFFNDDGSLKLPNNSFDVKYANGDSVVIPDITGYATETYVNNSIANISIPNTDWANIANKPSFFNGSYSALTGKPTIPTHTGNLVNNSGFITSSSLTWGNVSGKPTFSSVATSGDYNDLANIPSIPSLTGYATESFVSNTVGSAIGNLINGAPTAVDTLGEIANALGNNQSVTSSLVNQIANKANISDIPNVTGFATTTYVDNKTTWANISGKPTIPTQTSQLTNDSGYITSADIPGIPTNLSDLNNDVGFITSWGQADWNESITESPSYIQNKPTIPTDINQLTDNSNLLGAGSGNPFNQDLNTSNNVTFNDLTLNGKLIAKQAPGTNGGYSFGGNEGGYDTGMFSSTDGLLDFYSNNQKMITINPYGANIYGALNTNSIKIGGDLNYVDSSKLISVEDKDGFGQVLFQNKNTGANASMNLAIVNDSVEYMAVGINSSNFSPYYNTLFELPNAGYISHTVDTIIGPQSDHSSSSRIYLTYNSGANALELNEHGAIGWGASYDGALTEGDFGTVGQVLTSTGPSSAPTWTTISGGGNPFDQDLNTSNNVTFNNVTVNGNVTPNTDNSVDLGSPTNRFRHLYVAPGTIYLGDVKLTNVNGKLEAKKVINPGEENETEDTGAQGGSDAFSPIRGITTLEGLEDVNIDSPQGGQSLVYNAINEQWENGTPSSSGGGATDNISSGSYNVTVGSDGVISMTTGRGGIEFGAMPEVGGPTHLHVMRPAGQNGSTDLYFGDDYNYVKLPSLSGIGSQGVEIGSSYDSGSVNTWRFETDGKLKLPAGGDIVDSTGTSVLGGSSSTPGIGTFSTLPSFLDFYQDTSLRTGQTTDGVFFSGNATGIDGHVSYPVRTNFDIPGTTKVTVTLDMVVNDNCSDFGLCVFETGTTPKWSWGNDATRIAAQFNCENPEINGLTDGNESGYALPGQGTYRVRFTYDPNNSPNVKLETLNTVNEILDTVTYDETLNTSNSYKIGFAADQDDDNLRTYIKNLNIAIDGGDTYTDSLQLSSGGANLGYLSVEQYTLVDRDETNNFVSVAQGNDHLRIGTAGEKSIYLTTNHGGSQPFSTPQAGAKTWEFDSEGDIRLPEGGDIVDSTGTSVLGGGSSLAPELIKSGGNLVASTTLEFQGNMYGTIFDIDSGGNYDVWVNRVTGDGANMTYVIGGTDDNKQYVYALGSSGSVTWKVGIDNIMGNDVNPYGLKYHDGNLYIACQYYNNNINNNELAVIKLSATDGSVITSWIMVADNNQGSYQPYDIDVDSTGRPVVAGQCHGESKTYSGIASQSGSGMQFLVINSSDMDNQVQNNPWASYYIHTDPNDPNAWYSPSYVNYFVNLPVETITGTGSGMTVDIRYMWNGTSWNFDYCPKHTYGSGYNGGDQVKILGSLIGGTDGVNDIILSDNGWYMNIISTDAGVTPWTQACPEFVYSKTRFYVSQSVDFSAGNWDVRVGLNGNGFVWTPDWQHTYGNSNSEEFYSVKVDSNRNVYLLGYFELQESGVYHKTLAMKLNSSGNIVWQKYVETTNHWGDPGSILPDTEGNCYVVGKDNSGYTVVTKLDTNGDLVWQSKQTNGSNWNNTPLGDIDGDGNIIVMGSWSTGNYVTSIQKISKTDGSLIWARQFKNQQDYDMYEWYDEFTQQGSAVGNNIYYGSYCYDANDDQYVGFGFRLPTDGTGTGTYGRYIYSNDTDATWEDNTSNAFLLNSNITANDELTMSTEELSASTTVNAVGSVTQHHWGIGTGGGMTGVDSIQFTDGSVQTTAYTGGTESITWTNPNSNVWRIEEYNGGAAVTYNGSNYDAKWFDVSDSPGGNNNFRGAIIQYHAYCGYGTIIGTIHLANDYTQEFATHTEHMSGNSNLTYCTFWNCNYERGQLYFKMSNGWSQNIMIQWTAKIFYGQENNC